MKKIILFLILAFSLTAQEKYLIFFEDKGISEEQFNENPQRFYKTATTHLSEQAIERRKKKLGDNYITFKDFPVNQSYIDALKSSGIKVDNILKWFNAVSIYANDNQIASLKLLPFVDRIEKVKTFKVDRIHDELEKESSVGRISTYNLDYGNSLPQNELHDIPIVHDAGFNGEGKIIGFLDSGFDWKEHPALRNLEVIYEYDYVFDDPNTANESEDVPGQDGHGTSVFSIAAGFDEGELVGPGYGASFMLAKTEDIGSEKKVEEDNFAAAVEDFEAMGADIITASLGYSLFDEGEGSYTYQDMDGKTTLVARAYNYAFELGVVTVAAAGNEGNSSWRHIISPADAFDVLAVGNVDTTGTLRGSSSRGPTADGRIKPEVTGMGTNNYRANSFGTYFQHWKRHFICCANGCRNGCAASFRFPLFNKCPSARYSFKSRG
ncbi:MAG: S8 family serine peptidase [Melioribacteraceae bacterium]|nr:S8 family serine peptidase [Melioribacteraceae bacterium]